MLNWEILVYLPYNKLFVRVACNTGDILDTGKGGNHPKKS